MDYDVSVIKKRIRPGKQAKVEGSAN